MMPLTPSACQLGDARGVVHRPHVELAALLLTARTSAGVTTRQWAMIASTVPRRSAFARAAWQQSPGNP